MASRDYSNEFFFLGLINSYQITDSIIQQERKKLKALSRLLNEAKRTVPKSYWKYLPVRLRKTK